jgi:predicted amidohydrolase
MPSTLIFIGPKYSSAGASLIVVFVTLTIVMVVFAGTAVFGLPAVVAVAPCATAQEAPTMAKTKPSTLTFTFLFAMKVIGAALFVAERKIPVASVQTIAYDRNEFERRFPHVVNAVEAAAARGARLIVLPEGTVPAYVIGTDPLDVSALARAQEIVSRIARMYDATIVYGAAYAENGVTFNTGTVVVPGGAVAGRAAKHFLWHFDERWFEAGRAVEPIDTPVGRLGVLICADGRMPTLARMLVEKGAEMLVMPTAWVTSGRDPEALENIQADVMVAVRARENGVPLVAANKAGVERGAVAYCGKSAIVDAEGAVLARAPEGDEATLYADVTVGRPPRPPSALAWSRGATGGAPGARRFAVTPLRARDASAFADVVAWSDVDALFCADDEPFYATIGDAAGVACGRFGNAAMSDPAMLAEARLAGVDLFVWSVDAPLDPAWQTAFARTRAAELRAYVAVIDGTHGGRAFAVDPDGNVACGTFESYLIAQFAYDPARTANTFVAPRSDVLAGLRALADLRAGAVRGSA